MSDTEKPLAKMTDEELAQEVERVGDLCTELYDAGDVESDIQSHDWGRYLSEIQTEQRRRKASK